MLYDQTILSDFLASTWWVVVSHSSAAGSLVLVRGCVRDRFPKSDVGPGMFFSAFPTLVLAACHASSGLTVLSNYRAASYSVWASGVIL
jgi:hypothetical protein